MSTIKFKVDGMSCAACAATVEKAAKNCPGVDHAEVQLLTNRLVIETAGNANTNTLEKAVCQAVTNAGYKTRPFSEGTMDSPEKRQLKHRLILSLCLMIPLMAIAMLPMHLPMPAFLDKYYLVLPILQAILAITAIFVHLKYLRLGFSRLIHLSPSMESLISVGVAASLVYSAYELFRIIEAYIISASKPNTDLYFDSAVMILTLATLGKYLEAVSKDKTKKSLHGLISLVPAQATIMCDGQPMVVPASALKQGDILVVPNGSAIPADGIVTEGTGVIDTSAMTGESLPRTVTVGDTVKAGTISRGGTFFFRAEVVGEETTLSSMIRMVEEASVSKAPVARLADKVCGVFVPIILCIALFTALGWFIGTGDLEFALTCGVSVLVIACPCSLGLATPAAVMAGTGKGAEEGILYRNAEALEKAHHINTCVFDKTGTVTKGDLSISDLIPVDTDEKTLLQLTFSAENYSDHPIANAICNHCEKMNILPLTATNAEETPGYGIRVHIDEKECFVGSEKYVLDKADISKIQPTVTALAGTGKTAVYTVYNNVLIGAVLLSDTIRPESRAVMEALKKQKIETVLLTGDRQGAANAVAAALGIDTVFSDVPPDGKLSVIAKLRSEGKIVAMIGDGINDAAALAEADVGISVGSGTDVAIEQSDIVLMKDDLSDIPAAISLSHSVMRVIKQNLFFAFFYNCIGVLFASGIFYHIIGIRANPMLAAGAMSLSSLCVLSNALRLRYIHPRKKFKTENLDPISDPDQNNKESEIMKKTVRIEGMMCPHCQARVSTILNALDGVTATVSLEDKTAYLTITKEVDNETIAKVITDNGYTVISIN
ncbi:MAG: heavy metal translocating P-type ATPase [Ruminococcaceae bacterium]|nr:heavy metal translocating P-type ATPase [Oscillospiraceae bacterium]